MSKLEELREQENKLTNEMIEYLEADDNRTAKRIEKKLNRVRELIEVECESEDILIKRKLEIYKSFIELQGLEEKFIKFYEKEKSRYE